MFWKSELSKLFANHGNTNIKNQFKSLYHNSINEAAITHIEWVINKDEDDGLENSLQGVPENEHQNEQLRRNKDQELCSSNVQDQKADDYHHNKQNNIYHAVELADSTFGVTK